MKSETFGRVCEAIAQGRVHVSEHAYDEAVGDKLSVVNLVDGTPSAEVIEDYPNDPRGRSCLVLAHTREGKPVHGVWAFDDESGRAILVTVYRPDPDRWTADFRKRRKRK